MDNRLDSYLEYDYKLSDILSYSTWKIELTKALTGVSTFSDAWDFSFSAGSCSWRERGEDQIVNVSKNSSFGSSCLKVIKYYFKLLKRSGK